MAALMNNASAHYKRNTFRDLWKISNLTAIERIIIYQRKMHDRMENQKVCEILEEMIKWRLKEMQTKKLIKVKNI